MTSKYRYLIPNGVTFASLGCGIVAIMLATQSKLYSASVLVLVSYVLDILDGALARKLNASSSFGLQLDSLVDIVSLGVAPATVVFVYLNSVEGAVVLEWSLVVFFVFAGAFRLARFNLLPAKESSGGDSVGLTISTGGASAALLILSELTPTGLNATVSVFYLILFSVAVMMISRFSFPSIFWVFSARWRVALLLPAFAITIWHLSLFDAWLFWTMAYFIVSLLRDFVAGYKNNFGRNLA